MIVYDETITKIQQLPEPLVREVNDSVDFLLTKHDSAPWLMGEQESAAAIAIAEEGMSDYLANLEDYEQRLARGEIQW